MKAFSLSVPANLLLLGEFAVLEEGGLGIALATRPRARVDAIPGARPRDGLHIHGSMGPASVDWQEGTGADCPTLLASCLLEARRALGEAGLPSGLAGTTIDIDSSAFFDPGGAKRGFGSSAAVAVGLVAALLRAGGLAGAALEAAVFPAALAAHRGAQGGRGSGYDVAASRSGGLGLFSGGVMPAFRPLPGLALPRLGLFAGPAPVSTASAVPKYLAWKAADPAAHRAFLLASRASVEAFVAAAGGEGRLAALRAGAGAGIALGEAIGVPAAFPSGFLENMDLASSLSVRVLKALGAGNEVGLLATEGEMPEGLLPLVPEAEGLRWE